MCVNCYRLYLYLQAAALWAWAFHKAWRNFLKFVISLKWLAECYSKTDLIFVSTTLSYSLFVIFSHLWQSKLLKMWHYIPICFPWGRRPLVGQSLHFTETWRSCSDAAHEVGILWASDQPDTEKSTWQHTTLTADRHDCCRRDSNPHEQQESGLRPTS
jgi:hypothetical protein